jgi:antitoxin (DNA-binding transcriptional repressor) of toxin-antitoxin stability system
MKWGSSLTVARFYTKPPDQIILEHESAKLSFILKSRSDHDADDRCRYAEIMPIQALDRSYKGLYKSHMKTLTITDAKKNLGRWLAAAARGEDVGIVCGADIIALRKVEIESTDYAQHEYGATADQVAALEKATAARYRKLKRSGKLVTVSAEQLRKMIG